MMHIVDMSDILYDNEYGFHFAVYNTIVARFLYDEFGDQVWTRAEWEETNFSEGLKARIRRLIDGR